MIAVYGYVMLNQPGTVEIKAQTHNPAQTTDVEDVPVKVQATVDGMTGTTPFSVSLPQGNYQVNYSSIPWYQTPASKEVAVAPGQTVYAVAQYLPTVRVIGVSPSGFNSSLITVLHGVTPVVWINRSGSSVTFDSNESGMQILGAGQNVTVIYPDPGNFGYALLSSNVTLIVRVA